MSGPTGGAGGGTERGRRRPKGPLVGTVRTGMVVAQAKKGVLVELGGTELLLARARYGAAADRIEALGYGDALTVEVVADPGQSGGAGLSRVAIERSVRQPRQIEGELRRRGFDLLLAPSDGSPPYPVVVLDRAEVEDLVGTVGRWFVGAPHRGVRFVVVEGP